MWGIVALGIFFIVAGAGLVAILFVECGPADILCGLLDDMKNRNDRGKLRRPSDKYVSR